jgi:hypothetical protein
LLKPHKVGPRSSTQKLLDVFRLYSRNPGQQDRLASPTHDCGYPEHIFDAWVEE